MTKEWIKKHFDHRISLRERMFRLVTGVCMVALIFILPMGRSIVNLLILAGSLVYMAAAVDISIKKERINEGATSIAVLMLVVLPVSFFTAGGFYSGVPEWFVLCFIYISITLAGRRKLVFFLLCTVETLLCYYIAYSFPEHVAQNAQAQSFLSPPTPWSWWVCSPACCCCF